MYIWGYIITFAFKKKLIKVLKLNYGKFNSNS